MNWYCSILTMCSYSTKDLFYITRLPNLKKKNRYIILFFDTYDLKCSYKSLVYIYVCMRV